MAKLFLKEFEGHDAFAAFPKEAQALAHKVITFIFNAEMSRHSLALVSAQAAFHAVATRGFKADEAFGTGSGSERPLFAGKGGADVLRGKTTGADADTRYLRAAADILNFHAAVRNKDEGLYEFVKRKTLEAIAALDKHTGKKDDKEKGEGSKEVALTQQALAAISAVDLNPKKQDDKGKGDGKKDDKEKAPAFKIDETLLQLIGQALLAHLKQIVNPTKAKETSTQTLTSLGFTIHDQPGDANDCAIYTLYDQLTRVHGIAVGDFNPFRDYIRTNANFSFGAMIDILNNGQALLTAAANYLKNEKHLTAVTLVLDAWSATAEGQVMEFANVASGGAGDQKVVTFYYNGVNHFDSLTGGLART